MAPDRGLPGISGLLAITLVTKSRPGPKLVFHYPLTPHEPSDISARPDRACDSDGSRSDAEPSASTSEALQKVVSSASKNAGNDSVRASLSATTTRERATSDRSQASTAVPASRPVDHGELLGYSKQSLAKLLAPDRWRDRERFEVGLGGLKFLGCPVFAHEEKGWGERRKGVNYEPVLDQQPEDGNSRTGSDGPEQHAGAVNVPATFATTRPTNTGLDDASLPDESYTTQGRLSVATSYNSISTASGATAEEMSMFHVVFIFSQALVDRAQEQLLYKHIIKPLAKASNYCQRYNHYISSQARQIMAIRAKTKLDSFPAEAALLNVLEGSELALAMKTVFEQISVGEIAAFTLDGLEMALQIPLRPTSILAQPCNPNSPHLAEIIQEHGDNVQAHSAIILLEDKDVLLRTLSHPHAVPLSHFIRGLTPTKSLQKHSSLLRMPVKDVLYLARHLIQWRKARSISPLHPRNYYTVHPRAPMKRLPTLALEYASCFSGLPSLPKMLQMLSGKPVQYGLRIPSKQHRQPYMEILGWMVREGFVVQLRTVGWVKLPNAVMRAEQAEAGSGAVEADRLKPVTVSSLLSPVATISGDNETESVSSECTAVPVNEASTAAATISSTANGDGDGFAVVEEDYSVITNPANLTPLEARCLDNLRGSMKEDGLREHWPALLKYLDGKHALEDFAALEGLKRAKVEAWIDLLVKKDVVMVVRHW